MNYSLDKLEMIAQGGQAQIYDLGQGRVLRVLRNPEDKELLQTEVEVLGYLKRMDMDVPEVFECLLVEGRPAAVVEKINGISMFDSIMHNFGCMEREVRTLAELHITLGAIHPEFPLVSIKDRASYLIGQTDLLSPEIKGFVSSLLNELSDGISLCHGDFHPGNILIAQGKHYIIDWFGAYQGDILSDIAHSYLLMKSIPEIPGIDRAQMEQLQSAGSVLALTYINEIRNLFPFSWGEFSKWLLINAAQRTYFGMTSEKAALVRFIENVYEQTKNGLPIESCYKAW